MDYVDLDRLFIPIKRDADATLEWGPYWGRKFGGWLDWKSVLSHWRVVLLAEALSGKTKEFQNQAAELRRQGMYGFFVSIEDLADDRFEAALDEAERLALHSWKESGAGEAWFFLDSVDEARLNGKKLAAALRGFRAAISSANLNRAHIVVSCRVSDWKGKADRETLAREVPYVRPVTEALDLDPDQVLLSPLFDKSSRERRTSVKPTKADPSELLVVQLAPLRREQQLRMAEAADVPDVEKFLEAVHRSGVDAMCERPGDLIGLIDYWLERGAFGSLEEMTEEGVKRKLREEDVFRVDATELSQDEARRGVERLAAALVFAKTFTVKSPAQDADPSLAKGAIESRDVLSDFDQTSINALLRSGLFAPGTYGRVRFHHRATQEYLAACWLRRLKENNLPQSELDRLFFVEPYGVATVVPSLRAVAAWLALWNRSVCDQVVAREPVTLIAHGDPKSLPLPMRENLLEMYARLDAAGDLNAETVDFRAAWMFSSRDLGGAVRSAWQLNGRSEFRTQLLQFIEEGRINSCVDLARTTALDASAEPWHRVLATKALVACEDDKGLRDIGQVVREAPDRFSARVAPHLAKMLYPCYLSTDDLVDLVDRSEPARPFQSEGFSGILDSLHAAAPSRNDQRRLAAGMAALVMGGPHVDGRTEVSSRHAELGKGLAALASAELRQRRVGEVDQELVRLLMAVERAHGLHGDQDEYTALGARVRADKTLNRQLLWADARTDRAGSLRLNPPVTIWQVGPNLGSALWAVDETDLGWLTTDVQSMTEEYERRIAMHAVVIVLQAAGRLQRERRNLERMAAMDPVLRIDLTEFFKPAPPDDYAAQAAKRQEERHAQRVRDQQSWIDFRDALARAPETLDAAEAVKSWSGGLHRLHTLAKWVEMKARHDAVTGLCKWNLVEQAFGAEVFKHFTLAMALAWRNVVPERAKRTGDGAYTVKHTSSLAVQGLEIDSASPRWELALSDAEVVLAMQHACLAGTIRADWVDRLMVARPEQSLPVVMSAVRAEFRSAGTLSDVLRTAAHSDTPALLAIAVEVFRLLRRSEPSDERTMELSIQIIVRGVEALPRPAVAKLMLKRFDTHHANRNDARALTYLGAMASVDPDAVATKALDVISHVDPEPIANYVTQVRWWLSELFAGQGERGVAVSALSKMSLPSLAALLRLAYEHAPNAGDATNEDRTQSKVQSARSTILNALVERPGREAYSTLLELSADPVFAMSSLRFRELAHARAEADGDLPPWTAIEVLNLERQHCSPAKTGMQLMSLMQSTLAELQTSFVHSDSTSRSLLARAENEEEVQQWLAERLTERAKARYVAHREPIVANRSEPDIVVTSTASAAQVAIEIKNANKGWTVAQLEHALRSQLAQQYLLPLERRHGILVISLHVARTWRVAMRRLTFADVILHLQKVAKDIQVNTAGPVDVSVFGLNAALA